MSDKIQVRAEAAKRIDEIAATTMELFKSAGSFQEELAIAQAISDMREALTPELMRPIMALMNTDLGFRTDRDPRSSKEPVAPYSVDVVKECFIEARLRGFRATGNEWNIIAGRFYAAKNGFRRKVLEKVSNLRESYGVPDMRQQGATVKCKATWTVSGIEDSMEPEIPVRVNAGMGADAIIGKAQRKLMARIHDRLAGIFTPEGDAEEIEVTGAPAPSVKERVAAQAHAVREESAK